MPPRPAALFLILALASLLSSGCTVSRSFESHAPGQVWAAMVAAAETPTYSEGASRDRWLVRENEVWTDEANLRLEVYRSLDRVVGQPGVGRLRENSIWRFQIRLDATAPPPIVVFTSRGNAWPASIQDEAARYFDDVERLLAGIPTSNVRLPSAAEPPEAEAEREVSPMSPMTPPATDAPPIDVDDLLDG